MFTVTFTPDRSSRDKQRLDRSSHAAAAGSSTAGDLPPCPPERRSPVAIEPLTSDRASPLPSQSVRRVRCLETAFDPAQPSWKKESRRSDQIVELTMVESSHYRARQNDRGLAPGGQKGHATDRHARRGGQLRAPGLRLRLPGMVSRRRPFPRVSPRATMPFTTSAARPRRFSSSRCRRFKPRRSRRCATWDSRTSVPPSLAATRPSP